MNTEKSSQKGNIRLGWFTGKFSQIVQEQASLSKRAANRKENEKSAA